MAKVTLLFQSFNPFQKRVVFRDGEGPDRLAKATTRAAMEIGRAGVAGERLAIKQDRKEDLKANRIEKREKAKEIREATREKLRTLKDTVESVRRLKPQDRLKAATRSIENLLSDAALADLPNSKDEVEADLAARLARAEALVQDLQTRLAASPAGDRASATVSGGAAGGEATPGAAPTERLAIPVDENGEVDLLADEEAAPPAAPAKQPKESAKSIEEYMQTRIYKLPEAIKRWSGTDFDKHLEDMDYGEQVKKALIGLSRVEGKGKGAIDMLQEIRTKNLDRTNITLNEISRSVLNNPLSAVLEDKKTATGEEKARIERFLSSAISLCQVFEKMSEGEALNQHDELEQKENSLIIDEAAKPLWDAINSAFDPSSTGPNRRFNKNTVISQDYTKGRADYQLISDAAVNRELQKRLFTIKNGEIILKNNDAAKRDLAELLSRGNLITAAKNPAGPYSAEVAKSLASTALASPEAFNTLLKNHADELTAGVASVYKEQTKQLSEALEAKDETRQIVDAIKKDLGLSDADAQTVDTAIRQRVSIIAGELIETKVGEAPRLTAIDLALAVPLERTDTLNLVVDLTGAGLMVRTQSNDRHWSAQAGVHAGTRGLSAGVAGTFTVNPKDSLQVQLDAGVGAGLAWGDKAKTLGVVAYAAIGINRDLNTLLQKESTKDYENYEEEVVAQLEAFNKQGYKFDRATLIDMVKGEIAKQNLKDKDAFQFLGLKLGVSLTPIGPLPIVALRFGILTKSYAVYQSSKPGMTADEISNIQFQGGADTAIFVDNKVKIEDGLADGSQESYTGGQVRLEAAEGGKYKLAMPEAQGRINVYVDSKATVAYEVKDGEILFTLDASDKDISIRHAIQNSGFGSGGFVENHDIYLTTDPNASNEEIWSRTSEKMTYYALGTEKTPAALIKTQLNGEDRAETAENQADRDAVVARQKYEAMAIKIASYKETSETSELDAATKAAIDALVTEHLKDTANKITYKTLTTTTLAGTEAGDIDAEISKILTAKNIATNPDTTAYARQKFMEATLHKMNDAGAKTHIQGWNTKRLEKIFINKEGAASITMEELMNSAIEYNIEPGSKVLIEVGTDNIHGYRTAEWMDEAGSLKNAVALSSLPEEIRIPLKQRLLGQGQDQKTPLGEAVLKAMSVLDEAAATAVMNGTANEDQQKLFTEIYLAAENGNPYTKDGVTITPPAEYELMAGLYEKCMNFALIAPPVELEVTQTDVENPTRKITIQEASTTSTLTPELRRDMVSLTSVTAIKVPQGTPDASKDDEAGISKGDVEDRDPSQGGTSTEITGPDAPGAAAGTPL